MCAEFRDLIQPWTLQRILQQEHRRPGGFLGVLEQSIALHCAHLQCTLLWVLHVRLGQCASILLTQQIFLLTWL